MSPKRTVFFAGSGAAALGAIAGWAIGVPLIVPVTGGAVALFALALAVSRVPRKPEQEASQSPRKQPDRPE